MWFCLPQNTSTLPVLLSAFVIDKYYLLGLRLNCNSTLRFYIVSRFVVILEIVINIDIVLELAFNEIKSTVCLHFTHATSQPVFMIYKSTYRLLV